ncbi:MAG TPA: hypothetical protein VLC12_00625 [Terriglobales bacterium]|nr:hypothetical protein [Terriglobales bacterium]
MMRPELLALYGGPDQVMGLASGIAAAVGVLLMFWNKVLVTLGKIANRFRPTSAPGDEGSSE